MLPSFQFSLRGAARVAVLVIAVMVMVRPTAESRKAPALQVTSVRLHHLHYAVADPATAMNNAATKLEGTRVLLQGLGVGVRVGDQYLLFDRYDPETPAAGRKAADAFEDAARWLKARGVAPPDAFTGARLAAVVIGETLDHLGFVADNLPAVLAVLTGAGARPVRESADIVAYRTDAGTIIELLGPTDLEDAFWCPMHPDVRSGRPGVCPLCKMALVAIPPARIGEYRMDVKVAAARGGAGMSGLRLIIRDPNTGVPVRSFAMVHERPLHLFIVSRTLDYFAHVHPQPAGEGVFELTHDAPAGEYMLIADFLPHGGTTQTLQRAIITPNYLGPLMAAVPVPPIGAAEQTVDGVRIRLEASNLAPRKNASLRFIVTSADTGEPVHDLEPFLGAQGHMLMVNADLTEAIHGHPEDQGSSSVVTFEPLIPTAGMYKLWVQFQRKGKVLTASFVIQAREG